MKIAIVSDLHLNRSVYKGVMDRKCSTLPFRNVDFMKAFSYVCDKIVEIKPDLVVIAGDAYDNHNPSNRIRGFFSRKLHKLNSKGIPVVMLVGNHDICKEHHALSDILELNIKELLVVEKPTTMRFMDKNLLFFPYSLDVEQQKISIKEEFSTFVHNVKKEGLDNDSLFFGHFGVRGGKINEFSEEVSGDGAEDVQIIKKSFVNKSKHDISVDDLDEIGSDYVFLGDYHRFQILPTRKCFALYTGSLEKTDISEIDQEKGFVLYDSDVVFDAKMKNCKFIPYTGCRPMIEIKGSVAEIQKCIINIDADKMKNSVVKISFRGSPSELSDFSIQLEAIKSQIISKIDPIHIYHVQDVKDDEMDQKAKKVEQEILQKGHIDAQDVLDVVSEMIKNAEPDEEEQKHICALSMEIYNEAIGAKMGAI